MVCYARNLLLKIIFLFGVSLLRLSPASAASILSELPNFHVTGFTQDRSGYIWIGTENGLCRYNGYEYKVYFRSVEDTSTPQSDRIRAVLTDSDGCVWVATAEGVCVYNSETDDFTRLDANRNCRGLIEYGDAVICYGDGVTLIDKATRSSIRVLYGDTYDLRVMCCDAEGRLWGATSSNKVVCYDSGFEVRKCIEGGNLQKVRRINCCGTYRGHLLFGTDCGIVAVDPETMEAVEPNLPMNRPGHWGWLNRMDVTVLVPLSDNLLMIGTANMGIRYYRNSTRSIITNTRTFFPDFPSSDISCSYTDRNGTVWVGTNDIGFVLNNTRRNNFTVNISLRRMTRNVYINSITSNNDGTLWVGTRYDGLYAFVGERSRMKIYNKSTYPLFRQLNTHNIRSVNYTRDGELWVATDRVLLRCMTRDTVILSAQQLPDTDGVQILATDASGRMWAGDRHGNIRIFRGTEVVGRIRHSGRIVSIAQLSSGMMMYVVEGRGVFIADPETLDEQMFTTEGRIGEYLRKAACVFEDGRHDIWVGTYGNGLVRYRAGSASFTGYSRDDGLPSNDVVSIIQDSDGNMWLGTTYGLARMDPDSETFRNYYKYDGLNTHQMCDNCVYRSRNEILYFGGTQGIIQFRPQSIVVDDEPVPLMLESLKFYRGRDSERSEMSLTDRRRVVLSHKQRAFTISYSALTYFSSEKVMYAYRLVGLDKDWNHVGSLRSATYSNLRAGRYRFEVNACNTDGRWNEVPVSLDVVVRPSPWLSAWAVIFYILAGIGLLTWGVWLYMRMRIGELKLRQSEREREYEKNMSAVKIDFFSNISHEFRTPLTMIYGPLKMLMSDGGENGRGRFYLNMINYNVQRLMSLVDQMLDLGKLESGVLQMEVTRADVAPVIRDLVTSFSFYARQKGIELTVSCSREPLVIPVDLDKLQKIITNLLSNALKYTRSGGHVQVAAERISGLEPRFAGARVSSEYLRVTVADDGIGMKEEQLPTLFTRYGRIDDSLHKGISGTGIGLNYVKQLVETHGGSIVAALRPEGGMEFVFVLPSDEALYDIVQGNNPPPAIQVIPAPQPIADIEMTEELRPASDVNVLVVEDNLDMQQFIAHILDVRYVVRTANNGREALALIADTMPDIIISDVVMPEMDGLTLCRSVKADEEMCHIPVIILSSKTSDDDKIEGYNCGADAYIEKPFNPQMLTVLVDSILRKKESRRSALLKSTSSTTPSGHEGELPLAPLDRSFMENLYDYIDREISNLDLNINTLSSAMGFSRASFYRKITALTGTTPNNFLRIYRLNKAAELILTRQYRLNEIAEMTGFGTQAHFSKSFKKHFGVNPKDYNATVPPPPPVSESSDKSSR